MMRVASVQEEITSTSSVQEEIPSTSSVQEESIDFFGSGTPQVGVPIFEEVGEEVLMRMAQGRNCPQLV